MDYLKFFVLQSFLCGASIVVQLFSFEYVLNGFNFPTFLVLFLNTILILFISHMYQKFSSIRSLLKVLLLILALIVAGITIGFITGDIQIN